MAQDDAPHPTPGTRQSLVYTRFGPPAEVLELVETTLPTRPPAPGRLRVAMSHVPVNPSDLIPITGAYAHRIALPATAGYEGLGRVIAAPADLAPMLGRRVLPLRGEGTWQSIVECPAASAVPVPDAIPDLVAARAYINPLAAATMLRLWPVKGRTVLLSGAGSSCAEHLGRWALSHGARQVLGIYRSESRRARLEDIGIRPVPIRDTGTIAGAAARADVTFDALGGPVAGAVLNGMRAGSDFVAYGLLTGRPVTVTVATRAIYHRFHMRDHLEAIARSGLPAGFDGLWPLLSEAPPPPPAVFASRDWRAALAEAGRPGGHKPVLDMSDLA